MAMHAQIRCHSVAFIFWPFDTLHRISNTEYPMIKEQPPPQRREPQSLISILIFFINRMISVVINAQKQLRFRRICPSQPRN